MLTKLRRLFYVDGLIHAIASEAPATSGGFTTQTRFRSLALDDVATVLEGVLKAASTTIPSPAVKVATTSVSSTTSDIANVRRPQNVSSSTSAETSRPSPPVVILDGLDFLLASQPSITTLSLFQLVSTLRSRSSAIILTVQADSPLLHNTVTPLETNHAHLVTSLAHQSQYVWQLRGLDTGSAKDVSGVVRVSKGGGWEEDDGDHGRNREEQLSDGEWLYQIKGDGSVRIWARGE